MPLGIHQPKTTLRTRSWQYPERVRRISLRAWSVLERSEMEICLFFFRIFLGQMIDYIFPKQAVIRR